MSIVNKLFVSVVLLCCVFEGCLFKQIPSYVTPCKRDQNTIDTCARTAIEDLRPYLIKGIPELEVPAIEPFIIPEVRPTPGGELSALKAYGKDIKVTGGGNFRIKSLSVDLDTFTIRAHVKFPKLHFEGRYKVDTVVLVVPIKGEGNLVADAIKCDAQIVLKSKVEERGGKEYIRFTKMDFDVSVKDYNIRLEGLFNGDKTLGEATNQALNQNKGEFLRAMKPNLEKGLSRLLMDAANKITDDVSLDDLLPKP